MGLQSESASREHGSIKKIPGLVVNLANNHIRDYGSQGVLDTIQVLEEHGIPYLGAGKDMENSNRSLILEKNPIKSVYIPVQSMNFLLPVKTAQAHIRWKKEKIFWRFRN